MNDLTTTNNLTYHNTGNINYSIGFNNTTSYAEDSSSAGLDFTNDISFSYWVKLTGTTGIGRFLISKVSAGNTNGWEISFNSAGCPFFYVYSGGTSSNTAYLVGQNDGVWHHNVITFDASEKLVKMYVDGSDVSGDLEDGGQLTISNGSAGTTAITLGNANSHTGYPLMGYIDAMSVWNRILTSTEASALYNGGTGQECVAVSPTPSITPSITRTPSITPSRTPSITPSRTPSITPSQSRPAGNFILDAAYGVQFDDMDGTGLPTFEYPVTGGNTTETYLGTISAQTITIYLSGTFSPPQRYCKLYINSSLIDSQTASGTPLEFSFPSTSSPTEIKFTIST